MERIGNIPDLNGLSGAQASRAVGVSPVGSGAFRAILSAVQQRIAEEASSGNKPGDAGGSAAALADQVAALLRYEVLREVSRASGALPESIMLAGGAPTALLSGTDTALAGAELAGSQMAPALQRYEGAEGGQGLFRTLKPAFQQAERETGVPWPVQAAQWALETGWGEATPKDVQTGRESHNLFGIKGEGPAGSVRAVTTEVVDGQRVQEVAEFRAYHSYAQSITEHARLLTSPYYAPAFAAGKNLRAWTEQLGPQHLGYATDPDYSRKLWQIITDNGWDR